MSETENKLKALNASLESCTYEEDKQEVLSEILKVLSTNSTNKTKEMVATFCIHSVFAEISELDDTENVYKILEQTFSAPEKDLFVEILFGDVTCVKKFFELSTAEKIFLVEKVFCSGKMAEIFRRHKTRAVAFLCEAILSNNYDVTNNVFMSACMKEMNGEILDKLIDINKLKDLNNLNKYVMLINDDVTNKNKVLENVCVNSKDISLINLCLDISSSNLYKYQQLFYKKTLLEECVKSKEWGLLYKLVHGNAQGLKLIKDNLFNEHSNMEMLITHVEINYDAANLLDLFILSKTSISFVKENNFITRTLLAVREKEVEIVGEGEELNAFNMIVNSIMTGASINYELLDITKINEKEKLIYDFLLITTNKMDAFSIDQIISTIKKCMKIFLTEKVCSNKINQMMLVFAQEMLVHYENILEQENVKGMEEIQVNFVKEEKRKEIAVNVEKEEDNENENNFLSFDNFEKLNKGLQNVLNFFNKSNQNNDN